MVLPRRIESEWLDTLPADDPAARRSRRDLRLVNRLMFSAALVERRMNVIDVPATQCVRILEIGAGDGSWMLGLAKGLQWRWPVAHVTLLDRQDIVAPETLAALAAIGWEARVLQGDVFECLAAFTAKSFDLVVANLFLHHFKDAQLGELLAEIARISPAMIACEPRRSPFCLAMSRMLWAVGCNWVSRHDAAASVRAGFVGSELSSLWPAAPGWQFRESEGWPFSHCFVAWREGNAS